MVNAMDVSELLAQKRRLNAERYAAPEEPEFTLTKTQLDQIIRAEFARREQNVAQQVRRLQADHIREVDETINAALAKMPDTAGIGTLVDRAVAKALQAVSVRIDATQDAVAKFVTDIRRELRKEIVEQAAGLRTDFTVAQEHRDTVVELPALPLRGSRRA